MNVEGVRRSANDSAPVVLVAEDEFLIRFAVCDELRGLGLSIMEAGTAREAIEVLRSAAHIDLVLTDVQMPGEGNGFDVARVARETRPSAQVVIMSGHLPPEDTEQGLCDRFLRKPVTLAELTHVIAGLVRAQPD